MAEKLDRNSYSVEDLTSLEKLEPVRVRPGMYIGNTGSRGMHHCLWEIVDNIDEITNGYGDTAEVVLNPDRSVSVTDNGRGVPTNAPTKKISGGNGLYGLIPGPNLIIRAIRRRGSTAWGRPSSMP